MKNHNIKISDIFLIPLSNQKNAYGQYIFWDKRYGPLCKIFNAVTQNVLTPKELPKNLLFPPVYIGFGSVFKTGRWKIIGSLPVDNFSFPKFRYTVYMRRGQYKNWKIYDGEHMIDIGELPSTCRSLEFLCGWSPQSIERRIATGKSQYDDIY